MTGDDPVIVARVARAHGVGGAVLLDLETDHADALFVAGRALDVVGGATTLERVSIRAARPYRDRWLVELEGVTDRDRADALRGARLTVPRSELPDLGEGYLLHDLLGLDVREGERELGPVREVYDLPAGPMLGVEVEGRERLIPFDPGLVEGVDFEARAIRVRLPEGLLDV